MVLLVDDSLLKELQVADDGNKEQSMAKQSRLRRLACKWMPTMKLILELSIEVVKLVSKVVNYDRPVRKPYAFV
jgi:hypothetical protein